MPALPYLGFMPLAGQAPLMISVTLAHRAEAVFDQGETLVCCHGKQRDRESSLDDIGRIRCRKPLDDGRAKRQGTGRRSDGSRPNIDNDRIAQTRKDEWKGKRQLDLP